MDPKRTTPRNIIIKTPKVSDKERILKAAEKETVVYKGVPIRRSADLSKETLQARRDWQEVFRVMKSTDIQGRLLYPAKLYAGYFYVPTNILKLSSGAQLITWK